MIPRGFEERTIYLKFGHLCEVGYDFPTCTAAPLLDIYVPGPTSTNEGRERKVHPGQIQPVDLSDAQPGSLARLGRMLIRSIRVRA